ncbi:hypothetical protein D0962_21445 [Leptolyngbyaceae cyanobacterium CCMR0082]|uniref:Uncharacterized protein n=2 Tax=Adonisia turfae TaxID=2950184 RepID=A0A6M0S9Z1_9CYAN|nr:hypothetical protein [Adonisia turfae CCMR0081]NEZ65305.1 hypothetical protein [Adonisia turfae CCMR0082]
MVTQAGTLLYFTYQPIFRVADFSNGVGNFRGVRKLSLSVVSFLHKSTALGTKSQPLPIIKITVTQNAMQAADEL